MMPIPAVRERIHTIRGTLTDFAAAQGQSFHTTREYVSSIFRKFGVNNRAALMALWLGRAP